ncbi:NADP oxidoreductase [Chitinophaga agrisoli]|uniref:NADP oxidoreductase n=1 Tax=Chitinophaga agrisoli TaxID=2607653 RepID=A0A5B2VMQ2_9BACT|nr:NAD(P)-binding domain-containing protein [Chitinophaga agrisoli]KAA2239567.1 NADP oxidoreductase [Chitinophaga agrisoli]
MKKTFGIIGAGNIAKAVAAHLIKAGYPVMISSRKNPEELKGTVPGATTGTPAQAAQADIVILAMPWSQLSTLKDLTNWHNRIVLDATNHFVTYAPDFQLDNIGDRASSEVVLDHIPGARLVKAFNTLYFKVLELDPQEPAGKRVLFISGNHADTNKEIAEIIETLGFSVVNLGSLATGGKLQQAKGPLAALNLLRKA